MDIRFCEACQESIPDADFTSGKALSADGRSVCGACVARRALDGGGRGGTLALVVSLAALAGVGWLLVNDRTPTGVTPEVAKAIRDQASQTLTDAGAASGPRIEALRAELGVLAKHASALEQLNNDAKGLAERTSQERNELQGRLDKLDARAQSAEARLGDVHAWLRELQSRAVAIRPEPAPAPALPPAEPPEGIAEPAPAPVQPGQPGQPAPPVQPGPPAKPAPAPEAPPAPPPAADDATLKHWIELLANPAPGIAFSATLELGRLKDLRAVPALVQALSTYKDFYVRLGAADALRELKAADAVPALIEALEDKDDLVGTAASHALIFITTHQVPYAANLPKNEIKRAQKAWQTWWKENEASVRQKLGQPAAAK